MAGSLGTLTLDLIAKIGGFTGPMDEAARRSQRSAKDMARAANDASKAWKSLGGVVGGAFAGLSIAGVVSKVISGTRGMQAEQSQLAAVLKSTGQSAGYSRDKLNEMADAMSQVTTFSGGDINQAQTALLAFTGIVGDQFPQALQAAADMASRTGITIQQASELIGRSLDVPSQGMAALSKQGFRFTEEQKKIAKALESTGRASEAQGMILSALRESYGGSAKAARDTFGGALTGLSNTIDDLLTGNEGSLSQATEAVNQFTTTLSSPEMKEAFGEMVEGIFSLLDASARLAQQLPRDLSTIKNQLSGTWAQLFGSDKEQHLAFTEAQRNLVQNLEDYKKAQGDLQKFVTNPSMYFGDVVLGKSIDEALGVQRGKLASNDAYTEMRGWASTVVDPPKPAPITLPNSKVTAAGLDLDKDKTAAAAQRILNTQIKEAESALKGLKAAYDPVGAAADEFAKKTGQVDLLLKNGKITQDQYSQSTAWIATQFNEAVSAATGLSEAVKYQAELEKQLNNDRQQYTAQAAAVGMGDKEADRYRQRLDLERETNDKVLALRTELAGATTQKQRDDLQAQIDLTKEYGPKQLEAMQEGWAEIDEAQSEWMNGVSAAWANYADSAQNYAAIAHEFVSGSLSDLQTGIGDTFSDIITGTKDAGDAVADLASNMAKSVINALSDMAAQWLVYQAVQLLVGKSGQSAAAGGMIANAQAASAQASLNAYASTAGIPLVGPALAPAAALAATAATAPMVAAVSTMALAGMAHDGIDAVPETGTWLLQKGERVTTAETSAKLDRTLDQLRANSGSGGGGVAIHTEVTVQAQPGASTADTQATGSAVSTMVEQTVRRVLQQEMRQGGVLWRRV